MDARLLMTLQVAVVGAQKIGAVSHGTRVTAPIGSGHFEGKSLLCTLPRFETAEAKYSFLNQMLAVGTGEISADGPLHVIEEIL